MRRSVEYLITVIVVLLFLGSCTSITGISNIADKRQPDKISVSKSEYLTITTPYTLESLLVPVVQMNNLGMSLDYFDQFIDYNDFIFPDSLFIFFGMETSDYKIGEGTSLYGESMYDSSPFRMEKALLSRDKLGNSWWQLRIDSYGIELFLEVLINKYDIPQKIRFKDSETGPGIEVVPDTLSEQLEAGANIRIQQKFEEGFSNYFSNPEIIGEEIIETPAGEFLTVLVRDFLSETMWVNYWLSPDVPGGIVRTSFTDDSGSETTVTELVKIEESVKQIIPEDNLISLSAGGYSDDIQGNMEPGVSEGNTESPILLYPGEIYYGSVGDGDVSYYKFNIDRRSDLFIEVESLEGEAELLYYGYDSNYYDWSVSSQGPSLNIEDYMVDGGETVYFSINDITDEYSIGEHYNIAVYQNYILDSIGIMMKGDIYDSAKELTSGKKHSLSVGHEGLDYYKTTVKRGPTLEINVLNEPDYGSLIWFDTKNGSFSGMSSEWDSDKKTITIEGLKPGTECYYYFSSDTDLLDPLQKLVLQITER